MTPIVLRVHSSVTGVKEGAIQKYELVVGAEAYLAKLPCTGIEFETFYACRSSLLINSRLLTSNLDDGSLRSWEVCNYRTRKW